LLIFIRQSKSYFRSFYNFSWAFPVTQKWNSDIKTYHASNKLFQFVIWQLQYDFCCISTCPQNTKSVLRDFVPFELIYAAPHCYHISVPLTCPKNQKFRSFSYHTHFGIWIIVQTWIHGKVTLKPNRNVFWKFCK